MLKSSLAPNSRITYRKAWEVYKNFALTILGSSGVNLVPISLSNLILFVAHLHTEKKAHATVVTYISAISHIHKMYEIPDPTQSFIIKKMLAGMHREGKFFDMRMPITVDILTRIIDSLAVTTQGQFNRTLYKAMFLTAFYGFMRIGEITAGSVHNIKMDSVSFLQAKNSNVAFTITFKSSKHSKGIPFKIRINALKGDRNCPVKALENYLKVRGLLPGPLFCNPAGEPVPRFSFSSQLYTCLNYLGLSTKSYKGHSFRIGAATAYASKGFSDSQIRTLGRWRSNAFLKYIRIYSL